MSDPSESWEPPEGDWRAVERARPGPAPDVEARMLQRLQVSIASLDGPAPPAPPARPWHASAAARLARYAVTFGAGVALGAQLRRPPPPAPLRAPPPPVTTQAPAPPPPEPAPSTRPVHADAGSDEVSSPSRAPSIARRPEAPSTIEGGDLAAETLMLDRAHVALARGDAAAALEAARAHERAFPRGQLAEDAESVAIQALVSLGRGDDARVRAVTFRRRWPRGLLRERVDAALRSLSETDSGVGPQQH